MGGFAWLARGLEGLYRVCGGIAAGFLILMALLVLTSIGSRLVGVYIGGLTEYAGYSMAAANFFALAYTFRAGGHIRVEFFLSHMSARAARAMMLWALVAGTAITGYLAYYMARLVYFSWAFEERSEGGDAILLWIPQTAAALGAGVLVISVVHGLVDCLRGVAVGAKKVGVEEAGL